MCFFRALKHVTWIKNILQSCQPQRLDRAGWNPLVRSTWRIRETLNTRNTGNRRGKREGKKRSYLILYLISLSRIVSHATLPENLCLLSRNLHCIVIKFEMKNGKVFLDFFFLVYTKCLVQIEKVNLFKKYILFLIYNYIFKNIWEQIVDYWYKNHTFILSYKKVFFFLEFLIISWKKSRVISVRLPWSDESESSWNIRVPRMKASIVSSRETYP